MQIGAENRTKLYWAVGLMVVAVALLVIRLLPSSAAPAAATAPPATAPGNVPATSQSTVRGKRINTQPRSLDPTLRFDWLKASEDTKYEGAGRNIFKAQVEIPKPVGNGTTDHAQKAPVPVLPPPPPPINLKFFGFANKPGEPKKVFLSQGEDVFIAGEGEIVDRRYKILHISPTSVEVEDVLNNNRQNIPLTQG